MAKVASAKRHAQAVYQLAIETKSLDKWGDELKTILSTLSDAQLKAILENPKVHLQEKVKVINKVLPGLSQHALNFVYLLVSRQRLVILEQIVEEYQQLADAHKGLEHANVTTAIALDKTDKEKMAKRLANLTGMKIVLTTDVNPDIVGGFVARIGDKLIDGSTKLKLEALKKKLITAA